MSCPTKAPRVALRFLLFYHLGNFKVGFSLVWGADSPRWITAHHRLKPEETRAKVSTDDPWYRMLERRFQHWLLLSFLLAICSLPWSEGFPVVPWLCPNDTDESARAALGMLSGLTALGQDKRVLEDRQVATLAEDGYVGKIINLPYEN